MFNPFFPVRQAYLNFLQERTDITKKDTLAAKSVRTHMGPVLIRDLSFVFSREGRKIIEEE